MTGPIRALLSPVRGSAGALAITRARLLDYKPGNRGLIRYDIAPADGGTGWAVFGKIYAEPIQAARVHQIMGTLWADIFAGEPDLGVPQPLGCILDPPMLLYLPAIGRFLDARTPSEQTIRYVSLAGRWLATLHQRQLPLDRQLRLAAELVTLHAWVAAIGRTYSDQAGAAIQLFRYLQERAELLRLELRAPIHKDFHYGHLILDGRLNVIDFDEMRLGDPNFDLAHFCANLYLLVYRRRRTFSSYQRLARAFLGSYAGHTGWAPDERFVYFFVYTCLKIAWQLCAGYGPHPRPRGEEQRRQVQFILAQGLAALAQGSDAATPAPWSSCAVSGGRQ
ncbi:MAG TPA: aminoglycoside phosphotransferase family protein [Roseiflexaceae bacterium]|nr:aminoglycoside phosphotransferase family protein [Roseiflexaceae bacterium]